MIFRRRKQRRDRGTGKNPASAGAGKTSAWFESVSLRDIIEALLLAVFAGLLLKIFIVDMYAVPSRSMEYTLWPGDFIIVNKIAYSFGLPHLLPFSTVENPMHLRLNYADVDRGEVVVFDFPGEADEVRPSEPQRFVKRVVGVPGDVLRLNEDSLSITAANGALLVYSLPPNCPLRAAPEPGTALPGMAFDSAAGADCVIPAAGQRISLHPENLHFWKVLIEREGNSVNLQGDRVYINGRLQSSYVVEDNYYFVVGDNAANSYDSRFWGLLPRKNLIGKAVLIYWSLSQAGDGKERRIRWERIPILIR